MRWISILPLFALFAACRGGVSSSPDDGKSTGASTEQCPASACDGQPTPPHECVGGVPSPVCAPQADGSTCRKQIDCVKPDPNAPPDNRGLSPCEATACGPEPVFDPAECLYGFTSPKPSCESVNRGTCSWYQRCRPKPCSVEEGTCNILDRSRLGSPCGADRPCPDGSTCASISVGIGDYVAPVCISGNPCTALTCAAGTTCMILESYPEQIVCSK